MINTDILLVTSVHPPFDTRIYHKFYCSLKKENFKIKILLPNQLDLAYNNSDFISFKNANSLFKRACVYFKILKKCKKIKPSIIIFFDPDLLPLMILYRIFSKTKVIFDNHEDYPSYLMLKKSIPIGLRHLCKIVFLFFFKISEVTLDFILYSDQFTAGYSKEKHKQNIIYNFPIVTDIPKKTKKYDLIYPGSIDLDVCQRLMKIAEELNKLQRQIKFTILGRDVSDESRSVIQGFSCKFQNVKLLFIEDVSYKSVQEFISESRIGLLPLPNIEKFRKNIPTKLFEYMLHSIPILASDLPPISYFLEKTNGNYLITEKCYQKSYATSISEILADYDVFRKKCKTNFKILEQRWNWDKTEKPKLIKIISKLLLDK